jgi:beta-hydroxyacyl-ACP dehydratase FabZ
LVRGATFGRGERFFARRLLPGHGSGGTIAHNAILVDCMPVMDIQQIWDILPHRYPMLLVDRIEELEEERVVGIKNVTINEPFFTGHFPDFPVMPGVMIIEAMAQVAGILVLSSIPERKTKLVLLAAVNEAKFRKPVVPGDQLRIEMKVLKRKATIAKMNGVATVNGVVVAEAEMMCKLADRP